MTLLQVVDFGVGGDDALAERDIPTDQRVDGVDDHALGRPPISETSRVNSCRSLSNALAVCSSHCSLLSRTGR
jgi:hypothetical protein